MTDSLGLVAAGVMLDDAGYIVGNNDGDRERSTVRNIYAIGDVLKVRVHNDKAADGCRWSLNAAAFRYTFLCHRIKDQMQHFLVFKVNCLSSFFTIIKPFAY